jgi:hypothetical protein
MSKKSANLFSLVYKPIVGVFFSVYSKFRNSKTARALLIIVIVKIAIFYGFFKSYLFPVHLKPEWESDEHRIEEVTRSLITNHNKNNEDD